MLVRLHFLPRSFFADRLDAQADFLFFLIHLDDLEVEFSAGLQGHLLTFVVDRFRVVAQAFDSIGDFHERAEACQPQDFPVDDVANTVLALMGLPNDPQFFPSLIEKGG